MSVPCQGMFESDLVELAQLSANVNKHFYELPFSSLSHSFSAGKNVIFLF